MKLTMEIGEQSPNEKKVYEKRKKKFIKRANRRVRRLTVVTFFKILYWTLYYKIHYNKPDVEYFKGISSPWKLYAAMHTFFMIDYTDHSLDLTTLAFGLKHYSMTEKSFVYIVAQLLKKHYDDVYIFWCGEKEGFVKPMVVVVWDNVNLSIGHRFKVHAGGQFEIMKSYFKNGSVFTVCDVYGNKLLDYEKDRIKDGAPDIICWDMKHWTKNEPTVTRMARQWNLVFNNVDIMKQRY